MEMIGVQRARDRDLATGVVLGAGLGLSALFLYWDTTVHSTTGAAMVVLFGSMFAINSHLVPAILITAVIPVIIVVVLYRPLMLCGVHPDLAAAVGVPVRAVGAAYLAAMAIVVGL